MDTNNFIMSYSIDKNFDSERFLKLRLRVCHDQESPNKTFFTVETMKEANKTLEYIPLLAHVYTDENGKPVIGSHDMHIEEDKLNPDEAKLIYDETPIGVIPSLSDNNCSIEEFEGLNYTFVDCYVWRDYANYAEQLIEDAGDTKLSMEIDFPEDSLSYDAKNDRYNISSYRYRGITLLNESLGTGMKKAMATTGTFSANMDIKERMIILMEELQKCLREYDINDFKEKGVENNMNLDELLEKYGLTRAEIDFEVEGLSDEELENALSEFACKKKKCALDEHFNSLCEKYGVTVEEVEFDYSNMTIEELDAKFEEVFACNKKKKCELDYLECSFRISHDDTRYGLQSLLNAMCDESHFFAIESVYDKYFYYCDYFSGDAFKQNYKVRKDVVSFDGNPEPVYREFVTQSERDELENMRKNYAALVEFKQNIEAAELKAKKDEIFARTEYSVLAEDEDFKALVSNAEKYSVEECENKADVMFAKYCKSHGEFAAKEEKKTSKVIGVNFAQETETKDPYGGLWAEYKKKNR